MKQNDDNQTRRQFVRTAALPLVGAVLFAAATSPASAKGYSNAI